MPDRTFRTAVDVRFAHCDPAGIVFFPRYFEMINGVVEDWFASGLSWPFPYLHVERGEGVPTVDAGCQFMSPSRMGDRLEFELSVAALGTSSFTLNIAATNRGVAVLKATHVLVYISRKKEGEEHSIAIPDSLRERMAAYCGTEDSLVSPSSDLSTT